MSSHLDLDAIEREYRTRLRSAVEAKLGRGRGRNAAFAKKWDRSDADVKRLFDLGVPTTLSNITSLATALGITVGELVWPLLSPEDPAGAAQEAENLAMRADVEVLRDLLNQFGDAARSDEAQRFARFAALLGMYAPEELRAFGNLLESRVNALRQANRPEWSDPTNIKEMKK